MHRIVSVVFCLASSLAMPVAGLSEPRSCRYDNLRYSFSLTKPCAFFERFNNIFQSDNGDGVILISEPEHVEIRIYGSLLPDESREGFTAKDVFYPPSGMVLVDSREIVKKETRQIEINFRSRNQTGSTLTISIESDKLSLSELSDEARGVLSGIEYAGTR